MMEAMLQHLKMKRTLAAASMEAAAKKAAADAALAAKKAAQDPAQKAARDGAVWKQVQEPAAHITPAAWCAPEMVGCSDAEINRRSLEGYMVRSKWKTGCLQLSYEEGDKSKGHAGAEKVKPGQKKTNNQRAPWKQQSGHKKATDAFGVIMPWARKAADEAAAAKVTKEADDLAAKNSEEKKAKHSEWQ